MPKTKLDKAISGYYGDKKKKKKKDNKVSNSYEDLQRKQNEQKQEQGRKVAQQKKETPQKSSTPLSKAIEKDSKRTQETKTGTRKTSNSWGEYVRKANKAYTKAGREEANKSWSEKQAERRKNKDNITSLGTIAGSNSLQYSGQKHTPLGDAIYKNATGRDAAPTRYEKSIGLADTKTDIERINGTGETALSKMAIRNQGERQKKQAKKDVDATIKNWEEANGITFSEEEKKSIRKEMGLDDYLKEVDEATKESLKTANEGIKAANRRATNKMVQAMDEQSGKAEERKKKTFKYGDITDEEQDIIIQANQAFPGNREAQNNYIRSRGGDELLYKIGDVNAATLYKSPFMSGFMEGSSPISAYDSAAGEYSDQAREVMQEGRGNAAYLAGYMGGFGAQFAGSGVNAAAEQLAGRVLPRIGSQFGRFAVNRLGETVLESPLDIADAYKNSIDAEGNFDANEFKRQMAFNVGMNVGIGGAIDVGGNLLTKKQAKQFLNLESKRIAGTLSGNDEIKYLELRQKLNDKASERFNLSTDTAGNTLENARQMRTDVNNARVDEAVRRANTNLENARTDRAVAQSNETARQNRTAAENARVDRTVARAQENMPQRAPVESYDIDSIPNETLTDLLIHRDVDGNYYDLFSGDPMSRAEVEDIIRENGGIPENVSVINKDVPLESNDINELKRIQEYNGTTGEIRDEDIAIIRDVNNKVKADIDTRTVDNVGRRQVKAYQYEHPELKEFYQNEAEIMEEELARGVRGERWGNEYGQFATIRAQSETIETLRDQYGMSYDDIEKGLDAIIKDEGAENIAAAKKIELVINDRLRYGYNDFISGATIAPNAEYIKALDDISKRPNTQRVVSDRTRKKSFAHTKKARELKEQRTEAILEGDDAKYAALVEEYKKAEAEYEPPLKNRSTKREPSLTNAIAYAKRKFMKGGYSYGELLEDAGYQYYLRDDEMVELEKALRKYAQKKGLGAEISDKPVYKLPEETPNGAALEPVADNAPDVAPSLADDVANYESLNERFEELLYTLDEDNPDPLLEQELHNINNQLAEIELRHPEGMEEAAKGLEDNANLDYNTTGGITNGRTDEIGPEGTASIRPADGEIQGSAMGAEASGARGLSEQEKAYDTGKVGRNVLEESHSNTLDKYNVKHGSIVDVSDDADQWVKNLQDNASAHEYGIAVDTDYTAEGLKGSKLLSDTTGNITIGVKTDGDIFGLAKKPGTDGDFNEAMLSAIANGGKKGDAYGIVLINKYSPYGMTPVARIPYDPDVIRMFANSPEEAERKLAVFKAIAEENGLKGEGPDVYVFMHNGDSIEDIIRKQQAGDVKLWTQEELDNLPTFKGENAYSEALGYRNGLLAKQEAGGTRTKAEASSKKQVPETKEARAPEVSSTTKANEPQPKEKPSEPKKAEPEKAEKPKEQTPQEKQKAEVKQKQKEAQTKLKGMSAEQYREEIRKMTTAATSAHAEKIMMTAREYLDPDKADMLLDGFDERVGMFGKVKGVSQEEALQRADQLYKDKGLKSLYDDYMNTDVGTTGVVGQDVQMVQAKGSKVFQELTKQINAGEGDVEDLINKLYNVCIKSNEIASASGRSLNAVKMMLRATPEGRTAAVQREMERLAEKYKDRLGGNGLVLSDETWAKLASDMSDDEITELMKKVNIEIWDQIPATAMEKFNELRHFSMLANPRTHIRNLTGNTVFKTARAISDSLEFAITHAMRKKLEKMGVTSVVTTKITREEMKSAKKGVHEHFDKIYADSASRSRFVEIVRPEGSRMFKSAKVQKGIDTNYAFLDWEDVKPFLRPEYTRQFIKYCKTYGLDFNNIENIPKKKLAAADKFAMNKAEIATFRDNSAFSEFLVGKKQTLAGMKGKTAVGTLAYRAGSMLLDSQIPFVKTPINIFRRSIDYSPISLIRAGAELNQALRKGKTDLVLDGIHHLATGLTGTGIMGLGMWLYNSGVVTVEAGNVSGSEYYDRDMGYQDYSLIVGDKSVTLDWVSPIQSSFFMGAAMQQDFEEKGISLDVGLSALIASTSPMLEMSFMGTTKDTIETFIDRANKEHDGEMHWTDAVKYTIGGTLPQGWLSSFMPQVSGQFANILDDKQRDTRSTREGEMANAWDKFAKQTINRVPILRNYVLNPKIDRFGEDKETGQNVLTRTVQFMFNPATVKNIEMTDTDKEIIDIYNNMDDNDKDKKSFFYNFTGNPAYDLYGEKGRMTYDELYKYGKTNRKAQTKYIEDMINSDSYKDMTYTLKADEVKGASFISTTKADLDTYGAKYALDKNILNPDAKKSAAKQAWTDFKNQGGNAKEFVEDHIKIEGFLNRSHSTTKDYYAMAAIIEKCPNTDMLAKSYGVYGNKLETERKYFKKGGSLKEFSDASCRMASGRDIVGVTDSKANNSRVAANYDINERTYRAHGFDWNTAQSGAGLKKYGYAFENDPNRKGDKNTLEKIKSDALAKYDADHNNSLTKDEATEYVKSLKCESEDEAACIFQFLMPGTKNTFKDLIDDHLKWGENHDEEWETGKGSGSGKGSGKGRGRGRGRGRKSGGKSSGTVPESWWTEYLDDIKKGQKSSTGTTVNTTAVKSHNYNWDDVITTAYKNKTRKMRSKTKAG